ncbi:MAG: hypothetical protein MPJ24_08960 [Pirellulaceae bacterium]|nr:hypothetical protein [Pirellulaceae bacterium]
MVAPSQAILPGLATSKTASQSHTIQPPNHVFAIDDRQLDIREIERHIHQLGSSDYYQREEAKNWLTEHGQEVYPFLQKYVNDQNLEIRMSVRFLIEEQKIVAQKQHEKDFLVDWENKVPLTGWLRFQKFIAKASPPSKKLDQPKAIPTNGSRVVAKDKLASPSAPSPENDLELSLRLFYLQLYKHNKDGIEALETNDKKRLRNVEANLILFTRTVNGNMANLPIEDNDSSAASIQKYRLAFFLYYALSAERYYLTSLANSYAYTVLPYIPAYLPSQSSPSPNEEIGYRALLIAPFYITKGPIFDEKTPLDKTLLRNYYHNLVLFGLRNNFPETILSARKVLKNVNATTYYHQLPDAFEALVLFSDKSDVASFVRDIALVDQFLGDRKALFNGRSQTPPFRTHVIQRQDLALLTLVRMTGQNPVDYHFRNLYGNQGSHLAYSQYSTFFSSEADRTDAIERWNKWKTKKPFEKSSDNK